jgi:hypothetical protein
MATSVPWRTLPEGIPSVTIAPACSAFDHTDLAGAEEESLRTLSPAAVLRTNSRPYEAPSRPATEDLRRRQVHHDAADRGAGRAGQRQHHRLRQAVLRLPGPLQEVGAGIWVAGRSRVIFFLGQGFLEACGHADGFVSCRREVVSMAKLRWLTATDRWPRLPRLYLPSSSGPPPAQRARLRGCRFPAAGRGRADHGGRGLRDRPDQRVRSRRRPQQASP